MTSGTVLSSAVGAAPGDSRLNALQVAVTGMTGMVGTALADRLVGRGCQVSGISRKARPGENAILWDPEKGLRNPSELSGLDAVIHLAGENIAAGRWNAALKKRIRDSRVNGTRSLVSSLAAVSDRPKTLICASAIGFYGDQGDRVLDEASSGGTGFLADTCREWEAEAFKAEALGMRVVCCRIGVVLSSRGGALSKMLLPFRLGGGGIVGPGTQYWSWIGLKDLVRILEYCLDNSKMSGIVNAVSPEPSTNREFTRSLGQVLHRPTIFPMPAFVAKMVLGEMAEALLLASTRVVPKRLLESGFRFDYPGLNECLKSEIESP